MVCSILTGTECKSYISGVDCEVENGTLGNSLFINRSASRKVKGIGLQKHATLFQFLFTK